jgi:cold shock protein
VQKNVVDEALKLTPHSSLMNKRICRVSRFDSPSQAMNADEGVPAKVVVKWFNATKGFGFVAPEDGNGDAFLHVSVLNRAGMQAIAEGAVLSCMVAPGAKGRQIMRIISVLSEGSASGGGSSGGYEPRPYRDNNARDSGGRDNSAGYDAYQPSHFDAAPPAPAGPEIEVVGTVKWFKPEKGFGFVAADDGDKDVFVHKSLLRRAGLDDLESGQRVKLRVTTAAKGREATWIAPA